MSDLNPEAICAYIEQSLDHSPPNETRNPAELFKRFDEDSLDQEIADLWRWGILNVRWNDEADEQEVEFTEFGHELFEKDLNEVYVDAKLGKLPSATISNKPGVRVLDTDS